MTPRMSVNGARFFRESFLFFFQAEDGIRDLTVTGVQTCALPIWDPAHPLLEREAGRRDRDHPVEELPRHDVREHVDFGRRHARSPVTVALVTALSVAVALRSDRTSAIPSASPSTSIRISPTASDSPRLLPNGKTDSGGMKSRSPATHAHLRRNQSSGRNR